MSEQKFPVCHPQETVAVRAALLSEFLCRNPIPFDRFAEVPGELPERCWASCAAVKVSEAEYPPMGIVDAVASVAPGQAVEKPVKAGGQVKVSWRYRKDVAPRQDRIEDPPRERELRAERPALVVLVEREIGQEVEVLKTILVASPDRGSNPGRAQAVDAALRRS